MSEETKENLEGIEEEKKDEEKVESSKEAKTSESAEEMSPDDLMNMWEEALKEAKEESKAKKVPDEPKKETPPSQPAKLDELSPDQKSKIYPELEFILDIPLEISAEIGRTKMLIRDLLKLNQGSIIELEKFAGEPVEIYVNGRLMAKGEVVVVNDKFGVRITEIISAQERVKKLGS
ncbi:MAG: Flagellar motor switch/type III secretory pathway protein FliN [Thermodesulfobacterium sp.]|uniref:Flagellar motor switch protein FliN n=1 Tax=Candidatus Thermodesulfobacterium syntrophicum TaxID=3060442 RepID=A0AAE3TG25_9BACT|nr:Flagellar motor switch/type III secretory pathway protein FliN [Candidatus Thermodesulfobacterium syntrophicum]